MFNFKSIFDRNNKLAIEKKLSLYFSLSCHGDCLPFTQSQIKSIKSASKVAYPRKQKLNILENTFLRLAGKIISCKNNKINNT